MISLVQVLGLEKAMGWVLEMEQAYDRQSSRRSPSLLEVEGI